MRCEVVRKKLDRLSRQELTLRMPESIEVHLSMCEACRRYLARQERLAILLRSVPAPPAIPQGFRKRVLAMAGERQSACRPVPESIRWLDWMRPSASVGKKVVQTAVLACGAVAGILMGQQTWRSAHLFNPQQTAQADPTAIYELDYLTDAPGDSLAGTYLTLISH
jgi:predicted anti-sigma-YlaC factor YlaD